MVESELTYEQLRKRKLEENKKRMEELNLKVLSQALKNGSPKPKSSPGKPRTPRQKLDLTAVRRSNRTADKPKPNYKEIFPLDLSERPRTTRSGFSRRDLMNRVYASAEERAYAIERAEQLESTLGSDHPTFVKPMLQSHVTGGFWLGLPLQFCRKHMPKYDEMFTLVDEEGQEWPAKYLGLKNGLSGGWRGFSIDHSLVDGDALVFQLVTPTKFKGFQIDLNLVDGDALVFQLATSKTAFLNVYIIRAYETEDNGGGEDGGEENEEEPDVVPEEEPVVDTIAKRTRSRK